MLLASKPAAMTPTFEPNFSFNSNTDTCITIRTALIKDGKA
jgi:hypothetical protein